ncbi:MAG: diguanylate cyclase, partial [Hyphomicrobiales bacterium]|nr:diguanylate cyclase [Hyphomicrobiales bacterium]
MSGKNNALRFDIWGITASFDDPRIAQLTDSERRELRGDQVAAIFKLTPISVLANLANMITLNLLFNQPATSLFFTLWNLSLGTVLMRWIYVWRARSRFCGPNCASERAVKRLTFNSVLFAVIWAAPVIYLFGRSDTELRAILVGVAIGMVTGGALTLATVWQAALCFVTTLLIPAGFTILLSGFIHAAAVMTFGISFLMVVASVVLDRSSLFFDARRSAIHLQKLNRIRVDQLRDLQESSDDILWEVDARGRLIHVSERLAQIFRRSVAEIEGMSLQVLFGRTAEDPFRVTNNASNRYLRACMRQRKSADRCTITVSINKEIRCWAVSAKVNFAEDGTYHGFRGLVCDVTETLRAQAATELLAMTDPLTGLPNRLFLQNQVELAFKNIASENDGFTLVTLDLDRFKQINDTFGHAVGDELLRQCSDRLTAALRSDEIVTRYGGDEFVLLLRTTNHESLQEISSRLIRTISAPYRVDRHLLNVGASIGIALAPHDATTFKELLRKSDQALYRAKSEGRGRYCLFSRELSSTIAKRRQT